MIFINYRVSDTGPVAGRLADHLTEEFGAGVVFYDAAALTPGDPWPDTLRAGLTRCRVLVALIGKDWLAAKDEHHRRRIDDPSDWVRTEICIGFESGKRVIPVLVDGALLPPATAVPDCQLRELLTMQHHTLRSRVGFKEDVTALVAAIKKVLTPPAVPSLDLPTPPPLPIKPSLCRGRDAILAALATHFLPRKRTAALPKLPLAGMGGIGKSTVALWFLHDRRVGDRYGDRRHFVRLDGATTPGAVVEKIAEALAIPPGPNREASLWRELASPEPRLVVLDNAESALLSEPRWPVEELFEQLAGIEPLGLIATLRPDCPIGAGWLAPLPVPELDPPPAREVFLANTSEKFAADPDLDGFLITLDGWPLVIHLAAERAKSYRSIKEFRGIWEKKRADLLKRGEGRGANFAVSVGLSLDHPRMTDPGRRLLAILAQLPDGMRHDDLEGILPGDGVEAAATLREIGGLVFDDRDRLRMLAPLREYLAGVLPFAGEDRNRVVGYYCRVAEEGEKAGAVGGAEAIARVSAESDNCRSMIRLGLTDADPEPAFRGALGFGKFARFAGASGQDILINAADQARTIGNMHREAVCVQSLGNLALARSDHAEARRRYEQALPLYTQVGSVLGEANCVQSLGDLALARSDHAEARRRYQQALPLYTQVGAVLGEANCVQSLGDIALARSDHTEAGRRYEQALTLYTQVGTVLGEANCVRSLGDIALRRSDHAEARRRYEQALPLYTQVGSVLGEANCVRSLGDIARKDGDTTTARQRYEKSLELYQQIEEPYSIGGTYRRLARLSTDRAVRERFTTAAREAWGKIDRPDLIAELDKEFPTGPASP